MSHADCDGDDNVNSTRQYARLKTIVFCILPMCEKTADTYIYLISHKKYNTQWSAIIYIDCSAQHYA